MLSVSSPIVEVLLVKSGLGELTPGTGVSSLRTVLGPYWLDEMECVSHGLRREVIVDVLSGPGLRTARGGSRLYFSVSSKSFSNPQEDGDVRVNTGLDESSAEVSPVMLLCCSFRREGMNLSRSSGSIKSMSPSSSSSSSPLLSSELPSSPSPNTSSLNTLNVMLSLSGCWLSLLILRLDPRLTPLFLRSAETRPSETATYCGIAWAEDMMLC